MEFLRQLFHGKGYIDGITIINLDGEILFSAKLNSKFSNRKEREAYQALVGQNFFDVFENLNAKNSSMIRAMEVGLPVYVENQLLQTKGQEGIHISSLSIPIKSGRAVVGAIDLSMEEMTDGEEEPESVELTSEQIPVGGAGKLKKHSGASFTMEDIIAVDEKMKNARDYIPVVAACDLPVMIYGETGTGKEVFAQSIHNASERRDKPFIAQNCAALPDTLLESILFGTSKGAFTGAMENKGLFELADGGTLFLDEINSMPLFLQSKLLRVLQDGSFRSLGGSETKRTNVKIIAATNVEPLEAIEKGQLRRDIYYRLSMMSIRIPPLRERKADIGHFVKFYVNKHNGTFHKQVQYVSKDLLKKLEEYDWPGNVRELEHVIVYGMSMVDEASTLLQYKDIKGKLLLEKQVDRKKTPESLEEVPKLCSSLREAVAAYEEKLIWQALEARTEIYPRQRGFWMCRGRRCRERRASCGAKRRRKNRKKKSERWRIDTEN